MIDPINQRAEVDGIELSLSLPRGFRALAKISYPLKRLRMRMNRASIFIMVIWE
jgi:hypothetical protein